VVEQAVDAVVLTPGGNTMSIATPIIRQERLSELVTQLTGAPLDHSRSALADSMDHNLHAGDSLWDVAGALVAIRSIAV
jgi:hypothetical protein